MPQFLLPDPKPDGLHTPVVGEHSLDKHYFLQRYIYAFTTSMSEKRWKGLHYIDLFAGAGVVRVKDSEQLSWGSPLIAAQAKKPFEGIHLCEADDDNCEALRSRIERLSPPSKVQIVVGNANEKVPEIVREIPPRSLTLSFLDPCGLHLSHETVRTLSKIRCDLIIYFPDHVDALRNWEIHYHDNESSNLDLVLGEGSNWRKEIINEPRHRFAEIFRRIYVKQIRKLGYQFFEWERICAHNKPIYQLIFASRHKLGADLWRRVSLSKPDQQKTFDFGSN